VPITYSPLASPTIRPTSIARSLNDKGLLK
jgi:hypothetical protein